MPKPSADDYLFGRGLTLDDYYISQTPVSEIICFIGPGKREYTLLISDNDLAAEAMARLKELGVRVVKK